MSRWKQSPQALTVKSQQKYLKKDRSWTCRTPRMKTPWRVKKKKRRRQKNLQRSQQLTLQPLLPVFQTLLTQNKHKLPPHHSWQAL